jgi:hypothetical protein
MRKQLGQKARRYFAERLQDVVPGFQELRGEVLPSGWRLFEWKVADDLAFYIILIMTSKMFDDRFMVECRWSRSGKFPVRCTPMEPLKDEDYTKDSFCFRLPRLWEHVPSSTWWVISTGPPSINKIVGFVEEPIDTALARVEPQVDDAIRKAHEYAIPYFRQVAERFGYKF